MSQIQDQSSEQILLSRSDYNELLEHIINNERLTTVGRLTSAIVHEINNPLQAVRGALMLSQENPQDSESVEEYLTLSLRETERIIHFTQLISEIYRPRRTLPEEILLEQLLEEIAVIIHDETKRIDLKTQYNCDPGVSIMHTSPARLQLGLLSLMLDLCSCIPPDARGSELRVRALEQGGAACLFILLRLNISEESGKAAEFPTRWPIFREILRECNGRVGHQMDRNQLLVRIEIPKPDSPSGEGQVPS